MKNILTLMITVIAVLIMAGCNQSSKMAGNNDKADQMKARFTALNDAFSTGNTAAIDTLLAADAEDHSADPSMNLPKGPAGLKQLIQMYRTSSPDMKSEIKFMAVNDDILIAYGTASGTNTGAMMGMPATGKSWSADFSDVVKFGSDMKMTDHWGVFDEVKMMKDCGMMPSMPMAPGDTSKHKM